VFAPEGYINVSELLQRYLSFAKGFGSAISWVEEADLIPGGRLDRIVELMSAWMLCRVFDRHDIFLVSPECKMVRAVGLMLWHEDDLARWDFPNNLLHPSPIGDIFQRKLSRPTDHPLNRFRFVDPLTGTIAVDGRDDALNAFQIEADELIYQQRRVASQFDRWSVCVRQSAALDNDNFFSLVWPEEYSEWECLFSEGHRNSGGRPRKVDRALLAYKGRFPNGHGAKTWAEAASEISSLTGVEIHHETLMKAVNREKRAD